MWCCACLLRSRTGQGRGRQACRQACARASRRVCVWPWPVARSIDVYTLHCCDAPISSSITLVLAPTNTFFQRDRGEDDKKSKKHKKEHKKESKKKKSKSRKKEKEHKRERGRKSGGGDDNGGCGGNSPRQALVSLLAHHPGVVEELVLVLRALEAGARACVCERERERESIGVCSRGVCGWRCRRRLLPATTIHPPTHPSTHHPPSPLRNQPTNTSPPPLSITGQGVALDGIPVPEMRKRMGSFLDALGLRTELQGLAAATTYLLTGEQVGG